MSTLLKWAQNTQGKLNGKNSSNNSSTNGERKWIHPPEALQKGHIAYLVKFLGNTVVDQPKGTILDLHTAQIELNINLFFFKYIHCVIYQQFC